VYGVATNHIWHVDRSEDNAVAIFKSDAGVPAFYQATWAEWKGYRFYIEAYGDRGMVRAYYAPMFNLLIPEASILGGETFPAPSAQVWAGVSQVLVAGPDALHPTARMAAIVGAIIGVVFVLLEKLLPERARGFVPSPSGIGIAMVIPGYNSISMAIGAFIAEGLRRARPAFADRNILPVAAGFVAGESLMGIAIAMLVAFGILGR